MAGIYANRTYLTYGDYQIKISGDLRSFRTQNGYNYPDNQYNNVLYMNNMFSGTGTVFNQPLNGWDVSKVTNMSGMFGSNTVFNQPIEGWNVSSVNYMSSMFSSNTKFNQPLNGWA